MVDVEVVVVANAIAKSVVRVDDVILVWVWK